MGDPDDWRNAPPPRVPPQSEDFQETAQIVPPEQVRRIEADPAHGGRAVVDADRPRTSLSDPVPAERDMPPEARSSQPPTTVVDWRMPPSGDRRPTPPDPRDRHAGPGHAGDERAMLKDPATTYGGRHRPQASDYYRLSPGDAPVSRADAGRRTVACPAPPFKVTGAGLLIAGAALGLAMVASFRLWAAARR
jgi:hypothetical protein